MRDKRYNEVPCLDGELRSIKEWGQYHVFEYTALVENNNFINDIAKEAKNRLRPGKGLWVASELMNVNHRLQVMTVDFHVIGHLPKEISEDLKNVDFLAYRVDAHVVNVIDNDKDRVIQIRFVGKPTRTCVFCEQWARSRDSNVVYDPKILKFGGQYLGNDGQPMGGHAPYV